jgi:hypothetical protein
MKGNWWPPHIATGVLQEMPFVLKRLNLDDLMIHLHFSCCVSISSIRSMVIFE